MVEDKEPEEFSYKAKSNFNPEQGIPDYVKEIIVIRSFYAQNYEYHVKYQLAFIIQVDTPEDFVKIMTTAKLQKIGIGGAVRVVGSVIPPRKDEPYR